MDPTVKPALRAVGPRAEPSPRADPAPRAEPSANLDLIAAVLRANPGLLHDVVPDSSKAERAHQLPLELVLSP